MRMASAAAARMRAADPTSCTPGQGISGAAAAGMQLLHAWINRPASQEQQQQAHMSARSVHRAPHSISGADQARVDTTPVT